MKGSINPIANQVANGRKRMARIMVLTTVAAIPCAVFSKRIVSPDPTQNRQDLVWGGLGVLSEEDEHAIEYDEKGFAMVLLDQFTGAAINKGLMGVDSVDSSFMAQIEPFAPELALNQQFESHLPWYPESGDVMCLMVSPDYALWVENVGQTGQNIQADFGTKYLLNKRDDLAYLEAFQSRPAMPEML